MSFLDNLSSSVSSGSAILGGIGGLFNMFSSNSRNKANLRMQRQENEKNRQFSREMADLAYARNLEQWNRENDYNSPSRVRERLRAAGINADLIYGGGAGNMSAANSPQMTAPVGTGSISPSDMPMPNIDAAGISSAANQSALTSAQVDVLRSQAEKNRADAGLATTMEDIQKSLKDGNIRLQNVEILLKQNTANNIAANTKWIQDTLQPTLDQMRANIDLLHSQTQESQERIYNIGADTAVKRLDYLFNKGTFDNRCKLIAATYGKTVAETKACIGYLTIANMFAPEQLSQLKLQNKNLIWDTWLKKSELNGIRIQNNQMLFNLESDKDFKNVERGLRMFTDFVSTSVDAYTSVKGGVNLHTRDFVH